MADLRRLAGALRSKQEDMLREKTRSETIRQEKTRMFEQLVKYSGILQDLYQELYKYQQAHKSVREIASNYATARKNKVEDMVCAVLNMAAPEEQFKVKIQTDVVRNKDVAHLLIGKEGKDRIYWNPPRVQNGDWVKQLVSFTAVSTINLMRGSHIFLTDEPFTHANRRNLAKAKPIIENLCESSMQVVMILHAEELYRSIVRHEIKMDKKRLDDGGKIQIVYAQQMDCDTGLEADDNEGANAAVPV